MKVSSFQKETLISFIWQKKCLQSSITYIQAPKPICWLFLMLQTRNITSIAVLNFRKTCKCYNLHICPILQAKNWKFHFFKNTHSFPLFSLKGCLQPWIKCNQAPKPISWLFLILKTWNVTSIAVLTITETGKCYNSQYLSHSIRQRLKNSTFQKYTLISSIWLKKDVWSHQLNATRLLNLFVDCS